MAPPLTPQVLRVSVRDALSARPYAPPPALPAANLLYGEVSFVSSKVRAGMGAEAAGFWSGGGGGRRGGGTGCGTQPAAGGAAALRVPRGP